MHARKRTQVQHWTGRDGEGWGGMITFNARDANTTRLFWPKNVSGWEAMLNSSISETIKCRRETLFETASFKHDVTD